MLYTYTRKHKRVILNLELVLKVLFDELNLVSYLLYFIDLSTDNMLSVVYLITVKFN